MLSVLRVASLLRALRKEVILHAGQWESAEINRIWLSSNSGGSFDLAYLDLRAMLKLLL